MCPTKPIIAIVRHETPPIGLPCSRHSSSPTGRESFQSHFTSSPSRLRKAGDRVSIKNESSVSRFADRELRLVEPNRVKNGPGAEPKTPFGDTQIPDRYGNVSGEGRATNDDLPFA